MDVFWGIGVVKFFKSVLCWEFCLMVLMVYRVGKNIRELEGRRGFGIRYIGDK